MTLPPDPSPDILLRTAPTMTKAERRATRPPRRLAVAIALVTAGWGLPFVAGTTVLLPSRIEAIAPNDKVGIVALLGLLGAAVALGANLLFGALSDRTRSRFGKRNPWIVIGLIGISAGLTACAFADRIETLIAGWLLFQFFVNAIIAGMIAVIPDRVPLEHQGTYSAVWGVAQLVGGAGGSIIGGIFVTNVTTAFLVFAALAVVLAVIVPVLAPEASNRDEPRIAHHSGSFLNDLRLPSEGAGDFYLTGAARLLYTIAVQGLLGYQLFILTDFIGATKAEAGVLISTIGAITLLVGLILGGAVGPISDRLGRRKVFVVVPPFIIAGGLIALAIVPSVPMMLAYGILAAACMAVYGSIEQAVSYQVLPDKRTAAKDLALLNVATTGGQVVAPMVAGAIIGTALGYAGMIIAMSGGLVLSAIAFARLKRIR